MATAGIGRWHRQDQAAAGHQWVVGFQSVGVGDQVPQIAVAIHALGDAAQGVTARHRVTCAGHR